MIKPFGRWTVAACFNPGTKEGWKESVGIEEIGLLKGKSYICYDFWEQKVYCETSDSVEFEVAPGGVLVLSIREMKDEPFVLSTDRHIMQGAVELETAGFDKESGILSGTSVGPAGSSHNVVVYVPDNYSLDGLIAKAEESEGSCSASPAGKNLVRINPKFPSSGKVSWRIRF